MNLTKEDICICIEALRSRIYNMGVDREIAEKNLKLQDKLQKMSEVVTS